jgi:16S rRNA (cytosine1402-N4)-methyltransferase
MRELGGWNMVQSMGAGATHIPVLLDEVVAALEPAPGHWYIDGTAGLGGHAAAIAGRIMHPSGDVRLLLCDVDQANLQASALRVRNVMGSQGGVETLHGTFALAPRHVLRQECWPRGADCFLADLGFASNQVDEAGRGLSFMRDGPLDMRLDPSRGVPCSEMVNQMSERELANIIREYGEERHAVLVAQAIVQARKEAPIQTTLQLAEIVRDSLRGKYGPAHGKDGGIDPATRTFQGLRIATNDEMGHLDAVLAHIEQACHAVAAGKQAWLAPGARVAIITFHSLEDRPVKQMFTRLVKAGVAIERIKGVVEAGEAEQRSNPRSRSAKLRAISLLPAR